MLLSPLPLLNLSSALLLSFECGPVFLSTLRLSKLFTKTLQLVLRNVCFLCPLDVAAELVCRFRTAQSVSHCLGGVDALANLLQGLPEECHLLGHVFVDVCHLLGYIR